MKDKIIDIKGLVKKYDTKIIFLNFDFYIKKNEYVIVLGKSGEGKSTLLNIIGLLDYEYDGAYFLDGQNVNQINDRKKSKLRNEYFGFVFQNYNLIEELSVIDNIYLPYAYSEKDLNNNQKKYIDDLLNEFNIYDMKQCKVKCLSGGEKQRVAMVRALALNPPIIIADEPTGNLDKENEKIVFDFLKKMKCSGKSIVVVTHNLNITKECDRIIDLSGGVLLRDF